MKFSLMKVFPFFAISVLLGFVLGRLDDRGAVSMGALEQDASKGGIAQVAELKRVAEFIAATIDTPAQTDEDRVNQATRGPVESWPVDTLPQLTSKINTPSPASGAPERGNGIGTAHPAWRNQQEVSPAAAMQVLDRLPCVAARVSSKNGVLTLRGYVIEGTDVKQIRGDLLALGGAKTVNLHLGQLDKGQCGVVELYAPYWAINRKAGQDAFIKTRGDAREFVEGDPFAVTITTPPYESYVTIDYYSLDGEVVHMLPSKRAHRHQAPANYAATIGDLDEWMISMPYGTEMVTALFTPRPLFTSPRDEQEPTAEYLSAVKEQLSLIAKEFGEQLITADFVLVTTRPGSGLAGR